MFGVIITSEVVPTEASAIISGETAGLERIRTANPDVDFQYLAYRKMQT